jgi:excisionase family DNA binding protein
MLTLGQAARLAGVGKTTLTRAIKSGRLSATRRDDGSYAVDAAELARVYDVTPEGVAPVHRATEGDPEVETRLAVAETELRALKDMVAELRQARDDWKAQAERLALIAPIVASPPEPIAAPPPSPAAVSPARRPWWRRLAG